MCPRERAVYKFRKTEGTVNANAVQGKHLKTTQIKKEEVSRMSKERRKIPMNLQFFAETAEPESQQTPPTDEGKEPESQQTPPTDEGKEPESQQTPPTDEGKEPTVQELMVELAKLKRAQEKAASEAAEYKKKYNAKLSEKEKADEEKARLEAEKDEQFQQLVRENKINKLEKSYLALNYTPDEAAKMAVAEVDEDFDAKLKIQLAVQKRQKREYEAEFYKNRDRFNAGTGGDKAITKEQFDNMGLAEKSKLYNENKAEYDRLMGM